ncbi:hypothetical protein J6590_063749 [Homalodisca vitripennis]|nr:hypothetical protein J6590_063749 [Homalodisca vitripennis]
MGYKIGTQKLGICSPPAVMESQAMSAVVDTLVRKYRPRPGQIGSRCNRLHCAAALLWSNVRDESEGLTSTRLDSPIALLTVKPAVTLFFGSSISCLFYPDVADTAQPTCFECDMSPDKESPRSIIGFLVGSS